MCVCVCVCARVRALLYCLFVFGLDLVRCLFVLIQTHERFKRTPFIRTEHDVRIFGLIPFF